MSLEFDLSDHGICHFVARVRTDRVVQVEYTGSNDTVAKAIYGLSSVGIGLGVEQTARVTNRSAPIKKVHGFGTD